MQSMKETVSNIAASANSGMEKTKATLEEKVEKMRTRDPVEKQMATQVKEERINQAELQKRETREHNAAVKEAAQAGTGLGLGHVGHSTATAHGTGHPTSHVVESTTRPERNIR